MSPVEHQSVSRVGALRTVRGHPVQPARPARHRVRPIAGGRRNGVRRGRPRRQKGRGSVRPGARARFACAGPRVERHRGTRVPRRRFTAVGLQVLPDHAGKSRTKRRAPEHRRRRHRHWRHGSAYKL